MSIKIPATSANAQPVTVPNMQILSDALQLSLYQLGDGLIHLPGTTSVPNNPGPGSTTVANYLLNGQVIPGASAHQIKIRQAAGIIQGVVLSSGHWNQFDPVHNLATINNVPSTGVFFVVLTPEYYKGDDGQNRPDFTSGAISLQSAPAGFDSNGRLLGLTLARLDIPAGTTNITSGMITDERNYLSTSGIGISVQGVPMPGQVPVATGTASYATWQNPPVAQGNSFVFVNNAAEAGTVVGTTPVGSVPYFTLSDGTHLWVANQADGTVSKISTVDGSVIGTFPCGPYPVDMVFDGTRICVSNELNNTVTRLNAATGAIVDTLVTGSYPIGLAFDGVSMWVANAGDSSVTRFTASTGANTGTFPANGYADHLMYDGSNGIWVSNVIQNQVTKLDKTTGGILATVPTGVYPRHMLVAGLNLWVMCDDATLTKIVASSASVVGSYPVTSVGGDGFTFDGTNIWVPGLYTNDISIITEATGTQIATAPVGAEPISACFVGGSVWVSCIGSNNVAQMSLGVSGAAPTSSNFPGTQGDVDFNASFIYICDAPNHWVRAALSTF